MKGKDKNKMNELEKCRKQRDEYLAGWQRQKADFLNYQKEMAEKMVDIVKNANEELILELLVVLDSFDASLSQFANKELSENEKNIVKGIELIKSQLETILKNKGLEIIGTMGAEFDPELHEAIALTSDVFNQNVGERKGYKLNGKVIRPARVRVASKRQ